MSSIQLLKSAMKQSIAASNGLQVVLDQLLHPVGHRDESWEIYWVRIDRGGELSMLLTPPDDAFELMHPTIEILKMIQDNLGATHVSAGIVAGEMRYTVYWNADETP
jgi:hypothetical protein